MTLIEMFDVFKEDEKAWEMFITGRAGTGKTTSLRELVEHLEAKQITYVICAFTHKACNVLKEKLPQKANVVTLHSYLKKRPGINEMATKLEHVEVSTKHGESERPQVVIIDEFSMVGERDYVDLIAMQDPHDELAESTIKTIYIGDPYQLPPVGDMQTIRPRAPYWIQLTKVYRTDKQDILDAMTKLVGMLEGDLPEPIPASENIIRGVDLLKAYEASENDKVLLAWTNKRVQELNFQVAGKEEPDYGDALWNSTMRHELIFERIVPTEEVGMIDTVTGPLPLGTKYKTLEFLLNQEYVEFCEVMNETINDTQVLAVCFGTYNYKLLMEELRADAVKINNDIEQEFGQPAKEWANANYGHPLAKQRAYAWRKLMSFKSSVCCIDFPHAMTIHKSQGSTYSEVYLDTKDLNQCANTNFEMYVKLTYVAYSRASSRIFTS